MNVVDRGIKEFWGVGVCLFNTLFEEEGDIFMQPVVLKILVITPNHVCKTVLNLVKAFEFKVKIRTYLPG